MSASDVWLLMDEHPDSIDDGIFCTPNDSSGITTLVEIPGCQHAGARRITFARQNVTCQRVVDVSIVPADPDVDCLAQHTPLN